MPLQATSGAASYDGFGGGVAAIPNYIEDVFSTYLYTGNITARSISNGIDLAGKGGLVWVKSRAAASHYLQDTARGVTYTLSSDSTAAQSGPFTGTVTSANADGFSLGTSTLLNGNSVNYVSWTFRKQPKFFDVVTYTGDGNAGKTVAHNLGSVPGCIIVKRTDGAAFWGVYHRGVNGGTNPEQYYLKLDGTDAQIGPNSALWNSTAPTSTEFTLGTASGVNFSGGTYVAYLFAHDAGGFGLTGTDNVISCGSFSCPGGVDATVNLGYEPQWVLFKDSGADGNWQIADTMRGFFATAAGRALYPNLSAAEAANQIGINLTSTGFVSNTGQLNGTFIYIAIRRGPMKVPTVGTSVFAPAYGLNAGANGQAWNAGFPVDMYIRDNPAASDFYTSDRLRGSVNYLLTNSTAAESNVAYSDKLDNNIGVFSTNAYDYRTWIGWQFRRAPSFFDEVCYTGTGANRTVTHNLGVIPELMIVKSRSAAGNQWAVYAAPLGNTDVIYLNKTDATSSNQYVWNNTTPTSTVFTVSIAGAVNTSAATYVAYLFATCAGVSKCTAFTGTGTLQTINCGFTSGARFVLIKRTDAAGDWYVWDSSRGLSSSTDPYLLLNSTAAEVTSTNWVDTTSTGFQVTAASGNNVNINGASYIALAIA